MLSCIRLYHIFPVLVVIIRRHPPPYTEKSPLAFSSTSPMSLYSSPPGWNVGEAREETTLGHCFCCLSQEASEQNSCFSASLGIGPAERQCPKSDSLLLRHLTLPFAYEIDTAAVGKAGGTYCNCSIYGHKYVLAYVGEHAHITPTVVYVRGHACTQNPHSHIHEHTCIRNPHAHLST